VVVETLGQHAPFPLTTARGVANKIFKSAHSERCVA
jgi:hypothetical protein